MFTRQEASRIRQEFWTAFGKYMSPVPSADGRKVNWINYHTGVKDVYFRMSADNRSASVSITMEHPDAGIRELYFEQFVELKTLLHETVGEEWNWEQDVFLSDGKAVSRVYRSVSDVSVFNKHQWPDLILFFKPRIISLDKFWEDARYSFEGLR